MEKEKRPGVAAAHNPVHDLPARTGLDVINLVLLTALRKKACDEIRFSHGVWRSVMRPDINPDPAVQERDRFWLRIVSDPITAVGIFVPDEDDTDQRHVLCVTFADGPDTPLMMRGDADTLRQLGGQLALIHDCPVSYAPTPSDEVLP